MSTVTESALGAPWERPLRGRLDRIAIRSEVLAGNPLGDPARRPVYVYLPPGYPESGRRYASVYVIQGMTGQLDMWWNRTPFELNVVERIDEFFAADDVSRAVIVFVDAWTSYGGSQFINSAATGRYMDYLCDEVIPFIDERYATVPARDHRGLTGKSSGGYGAMVVPMLRPDIFGGFASHAGDALFEACYQTEFPATVRTLRDKFDGSYEIFWERLRQAESFDWNTYGTPLNSYAMAACYSPDESNPGAVVLPFEIDTGRLVDDVWQRWLEWDPVRMAPDHLDELAGMKCIYLDAGRADEFFLDLGAQAFSKELTSAGIEHILELFDGTHGGLTYRYPKAIGRLAAALSP